MSPTNALGSSKEDLELLGARGEELSAAEQPAVSRAGLRTSPRAAAVSIPRRSIHELPRRLHARAALTTTSAVTLPAPMLQYTPLTAITQY